METREDWEWEIIKLNDEVSKMSGRICLLENFIKEQFGNIFWNFCEKAAAAITPTTIGSGSPTSFANPEKYPLNLKNYSSMKGNQSQSDCQISDVRSLASYEKNQSGHPKNQQKLHQVHRLPTQRFSPQTNTGSLENSQASTLHPKLHHQLTVERNKLPPGGSSMGISGTKLILSNVSLPPSITITSVQGAQDDRDRIVIQDNQYSESALKSQLLSTPVHSTHSSAGVSRTWGSQQVSLDNRIKREYDEDNSNEPYASEKVGQVKVEHQDSYGEDSNDEDVSPCAMEITLDPTTIDFSDDYTEGSEDNEHSQNYGYESLNYEEKIQKCEQNLDEKFLLNRNSLNMSPGSSVIRTPSRPRRDVMQPTPCHAKCQNKCAEWSHADRLKVFNSYTVLPTVQHKESWIMSNLERTEIAKKKTLYSNFRTCTFKYYLPHPTFGLRQVCKAFFCATIGEPRNIVEKTAKALKSNTEDSNGIKQPIPFARRVPEKRRKPNSSALDFSGAVSSMMSNIQNQPTIKNYDSSDNSLS